MATVLFALTRSPYALILAVVSPVTMLATRSFHRRSERNRITRETQIFSDEVSSLRLRAAEYHQRERELAIRMGTDAYLLGFQRQRSSLVTQGSAHSAALLALKAELEHNPRMPLLISRRANVEFSGVLANRLRIAMDVAFMNRPEFGEPVVLRKHDGLILTEANEPVHLCIPPVRHLKQRLVTRARAERQREHQRARDYERLAKRAPSGDRATLEVLLGFNDSGEPVFVDLVSDGPHALVAGSTGSGKSELLRTLISNLASRYRPEQVQFLLVDFKGGASFQAFEQLPHTLEFLTDLEPQAVMRVVNGLQIELRRRERLLRTHRIADCAQLGLEFRLARIVIVVDEFATLVTEMPALHAVFSDIAARGRSLGIHLVLATQRPSGSVRDALAANCALRFCLRVASQSEAAAILGASSIESVVSFPSGMCVHTVRGQVMPPWRVHLSSQKFLSELVQRSQGDFVPTRPWQPPLPELLNIADWPPLALGECYLGLSDHPEEQRQDQVVFRPEGDGPLAILGGRGGGKTMACHLIATQWIAFNRQKPGHYDVRFAESDPVAWWQQLLSLERRLQADLRQQPRSSQHEPKATLWVFDDCDLMLNQCGVEHATKALQVLSRAVRQLPLGDGLIITLTRSSGQLALVLNQLGNRITLRARNKEEHLALGLELSTFDAHAPQGRGVRDGAAIQLPFTNERVPLQPVRTRELPVDSSIALVTHDPTFWQQEVSAQRNAQPKMMIKTPSEWLTASHELTPLRRSGVWLFDGCSGPEIRQITQSAQLPPPLTAAKTLLVWQADGGYSVTVRSALRE